MGQGSWVFGHEVRAFAPAQHTESIKVSAPGNAWRDRPRCKQAGNCPAGCSGHAAASAEQQMDAVRRGADNGIQVISGTRGARRRPRNGDARRPGAVRVGAAGQTTAPNSEPTPAVIAIASAPQKATRHAPASMPAPPARAATAPSTARNTIEVPETHAIT